MWYGVLIMLLIDLVLLAVGIPLLVVWMRKRRPLSRRTEVMDEEEKTMKQPEGGEPAAVVYVYKETVVAPVESEPSIM